MNEREYVIDYLRGFSVIVMILTHTTAYFPQDNIANFIWNWSHFAVPIFVFCSAYLFFKKQDRPLSFKSYLAKRLTRLLIPYYIFLPFFFLSLFVFTPNILTTKYIFNSLFLLGGVDINWLVLLFLYFALILPVLQIMYKKTKIIFHLLFIISFLSTLFLLFTTPPINYKLYLWIPWSFIIYVTFFFNHLQKKNKAFIFPIIFFTFYTISFLILQSIHHSTVLIRNKYPPNMFYLSYSLTILFLLFSAVKKIPKNSFIAGILNYFSFYSYTIYFLHYLVLTVLAVFIKRLSLNWISFSLSVFIITIVLQFFLSRFQKTYPKRISS